MGTSVADVCKLPSTSGDVLSIDKSACRPELLPHWSDPLIAPYKWPDHGEWDTVAELNQFDLDEKKL